MAPVALRDAGPETGDWGAAAPMAEPGSALPDAEIVIFDNYSTDGTGAIARALGVRVVEVEARGKGHAVRAIFAALADREAVVMVDGDGTYPAEGVGAARRPPVGDDDEKGAPVRVSQALDAQRVVCREQPFGERRASAVGQVGEPPGRHVHGARRRQRELGTAAAEGDEPDLVAPLVGVEQEGEHGRLDGLHPLARGHRARGVDTEQHEVGLLALQHGAAQVGRAQKSSAGISRRA